MTPEDNQKFAEVLTNANDLLETAQRVKGERFASIAGHLFEVMQAVEIVARLAQAVGLKTSQSYVDSATRLLTSVSQFIGKDLSPEDLAEATHLAEQMAERQCDFHDLISRG